MIQAICSPLTSQPGRRGLFLPETDPTSPTHLTIAVTSIFRCSDYIQAQLLAGLLRQHNIGVFVQGALLQGGVGELPAMGHLSLMVDELDRTAAERIIAAYERGDLAIDEGDAD
jgi:Putative prokaryotic signal transducing protein